MAEITHPWVEANTNYPGVCTFQDLGEYVFNVFNPAVKPPTGRELIATKQAILSAYRDLPQQHKWSYYRRHLTIPCEASQTAGTVAYDHSGGTYERMVTLTGSTWPTSVAQGFIKINGTPYAVDAYKSSLIATLTEKTNPGSDVSAGASYEWYRDAYTLPAGFRRMVAIGEMGTTSDWYSLDYVTQDQFHDLVRSEFGSTGRPDYFTIRNSHKYLGSLELVFGRAPNKAAVYDVLYEASPRELRIYKEATGTIALSGGGTTITGTGTAFSQQHVGSIIRLTASTTVEPTSVMGNADGTLNPFLAQRVITAVASATSATIDAAIDATTNLSGAKYVISDPVDMEPTAMRSALEAACCAVYSRIQKREDAKEWQVTARNLLIDAMAFDSRSLIPQSGDAVDGFRSTWGNVTVR
jgi:hypothetical protein